MDLMHAVLVLGFNVFFGFLLGFLLSQFLESSHSFFYQIISIGGDQKERAGITDFLFFYFFS